MKIYTTAPKVYDGFGTVTVEEHIGTTERGKPVRLVEVQPEHVNWQVPRYGSGMHLAADEADWRKLVDYGLVTELDHG